MGGLGNQLFQIFATIAYGLRFDKYPLFKYSTELNIGLTRPTYWDTLFSELRNYTVESPFEYTCVSDYNEVGFSYNRIPNIENSSVLLNGYFQSPLYFMDKEKAIFKLIQIEDKQEVVLRKYLSYFLNNTHTISIHFRLGDYKTKPHCHPLMPFDYYYAALNHLINKHGILSRKMMDCRVLYFCEEEDNDDVLNIIRELYSVFDFIDFVKVDSDIPDWEQMLLMGCCDDNIIANSTFSWWGAYFNVNLRKTVCYPAIWFGEAIPHNVTDLFPEAWTKIEW